MTLLLNLLPFLFLVLVSIGIYRFRRDTKIATIILVVAVILGYLYMTASPLLPKGQAKSVPAPAFQHSDAVIEDRQSKPVSDDVRKQTQKELFNWKESVDKQPVQQHNPETN